MTIDARPRGPGRGDHRLLRRRPGDDRLAVPDVRALACRAPAWCAGTAGRPRYHPVRRRQGRDGRRIPDQAERLPVRRAGRGDDRPAAGGAARGLLQGPRLREPVPVPPGRRRAPAAAPDLGPGVHRPADRAAARVDPAARRRPHRGDAGRDAARHQAAPRQRAAGAGHRRPDRRPAVRPRADLGVVGGGRAAVLPRREVAARGRRGHRRVPRLRRRDRGSRSAAPARGRSWRS